MPIPEISEEQYQDRLEWLMGAAPHELQVADVQCDRVKIIKALDDIKHAAEQCAKHLREQQDPEPFPGVPDYRHVADYVTSPE